MTFEEYRKRRRGMKGKARPKTPEAERKLAALVRSLTRRVDTKAGTIVLAQQEIRELTGQLDKAQRELAVMRALRKPAKAPKAKAS